MDKLIDEIFWDSFEETFNESKKLVKGRSKAYNSDESIIDYWINGESDLMYEINKKCIRLRRQLKEGLLEKSSEDTFDSIDDTLLDLINYAAFMRAYLKVQGALSGRENQVRSSSQPQ